jgi:hypothetical protein
MAFEKSSAGNVASGGMVGADGQFSDPGLTDGWFPEHPKSGDWETLKGRMLSPYELDGIESDSAHAGVARGNAENMSEPSPNSTIEVNTPLTMGGGSFAK